MICKVLITVKILAVILQVIKNEVKEDFKCYNHTEEEITRKMSIIKKIDSKDNKVKYKLTLLNTYEISYEVVKIDNSKIIANNSEISFVKEDIESHFDQCYKEYDCSNSRKINIEKNIFQENIFYSSFHNNKPTGIINF